MRCVAGHGHENGNGLLRRANGVSPHLRDYLDLAGFVVAWANLAAHNPTRERLLNAFHGWFDAFRTMRLMHHLTDAAYPRIQPEQAVPPLLERAGQATAADVSGMLAHLRCMQGV